ncbi:MAG: DUF554 domain-containing protein [Oscillospiraceae bacterium]|nr:DUF554 domain-containing protein [Oscillospiraceae bacterium]
MISAIINASAILIGGAIGLLVKKGIPERFSKAIMTGIGLVVLYIGVSGTLQSENPIFMVVSIALGVTVGTALKIDQRLNALGQMIEKKVAPNGSDGKTSISQGFVTSSLLFCVGAMAVVGSINSGLTGDHSIIFTKSTIDLISSIVLAVSLGVGVLFSAGAVLIYQGALVLLAQLLRPLLESYSLIAEINSVGSLIIVALGLNLIGVTKIKIADFLPAIIIVPILYFISGFVLEFLWF